TRSSPAAGFQYRIGSHDSVQIIYSIWSLKA
ncbi:MAG: hypothetical protein ACI9KN_001302, partial [Gammaproteobacteria bacterium]